MAELIKADKFSFSGEKDQIVTDGTKRDFGIAVDKAVSIGMDLGGPGYAPVVVSPARNFGNKFGDHSPKVMGSNPDGNIEGSQDS